MKTVTIKNKETGREVDVPENHYLVESPEWTVKKKAAPRKKKASVKKE